MNQSNVYTTDPYQVVFDTKIAGFNERKDVASYESLKMQIEEYGQLEPIIMRNGLCCDGRHRCKVAQELSIQVNAIDIDPSTSDADVIVLCNSNIFGGRNNSATQLAIKAFMLVEQFGYSDVKAIALTGLKDKRAIGYVRRVKASKLDKQFKIIATLLEGKSVKLGEKNSKSIEVIKKEIVKMEEEEFLKNKVEIKPLEYNYNELLDSELARDKFWSIQHGMSSDSKLQLIGVLNALYRIVDLEEQSTITDSELQFINSIVEQVLNQSNTVQKLVQNSIIESVLASKTNTH